MSDIPLNEYRKKSQDALINEQERSSSSAIYETVFELLKTQNYSSITLQQIAKITGISRTTIYRRWSSIDMLILDAISIKVNQSITISPELPPLDSLRLMLEQLAAFLESPLGHAFLQAYLSIQDEVSLAKGHTLWEQRYYLIFNAFKRLVPQKEVEINEIISMTLGSFYFQIFIKKQKINTQFIDAIIKNSLILIKNL